MCDFGCVCVCVRRTGGLSLKGLGPIPELKRIHTHTTHARRCNSVSLSLLSLYSCCVGGRALKSPEISTDMKHTVKQKHFSRAKVEAAVTSVENRFSVLETLECSLYNRPSP